MAHYHVIENTPGYLPDSEPLCFRTAKAAQHYAHTLASSLREEGYQVSGTMQNGYYAERSAQDLGRVIEIVAMDGEPCPDALD